MLLVIFVSRSRKASVKRLFVISINPKALPTEETKALISYRQFDEFNMWIKYADLYIK